MSARPGRPHKKEEKKKVPELAGEEHRPSPNTSSHTGLMFPYAGLLEARDYMGATTLLEFERKMFMDQKQASGWKDTSSGYEWVEGGIAQLNEEERQADQQRLTWIAFCAFHLGDYRKALDTYQNLLQQGVDDQMFLTYQACCLMGLGWYQEAEDKAQQGPSSPLQTRLLFHLAHRLNDENKLMMYHQKLCDTTPDQLSLASIHYLRNHFQEATDIYKRLLLENRDYTALNVYVALCYYKVCVRWPLNPTATPLRPIPGLPIPATPSLLPFACALAHPRGVARCHSASLVAARLLRRLP